MLSGTVAVLLWLPWQPFDRDEPAGWKRSREVSLGMHQGLEAATLLVGEPMPGLHNVPVAIPCGIAAEAVGMLGSAAVRR